MGIVKVLVKVKRVVIVGYRVTEYGLSCVLNITISHTEEEEDQLLAARVQFSLSQPLKNVRRWFHGLSHVYNLQQEKTKLTTRRKPNSVRDRRQKCRIMHQSEYL